MNDATPVRESLGSRLGFILLTAGCAIGLGNIWRFPFITGQNGGAIFVLIYLAFLLLLGFPVMVMELAIGRAGQRNLYGAYRTLPVGSFRWHRPGALFFSGNVILMIFYTTVTGWMIAYAFKYLHGPVATLNEQQVDSIGYDPIEMLYAWFGGPYLNIEFGIGLWGGYGRYVYYSCPSCGLTTEKGEGAFLLPNDVMISLSYVF